MIEDTEVIDILVNEYIDYSKKFNAKSFQLLEYNFDENFQNLRIEILKNEITKIYNIYVWSHGFMDDDDEYAENLIFKIDSSCDGKTFMNIKNVFEFLLYDFRDKYTYSKIIDRFELKTKVEYEEKLKFSFVRLCQNKKLESCCVCYEMNSVNTFCGHNLCRLCYTQLKINIDEDDPYGQSYRECPLCRNKI
jgi:hypothetical protein